MNCTECQDYFCKHRAKSSAGGQCFYESKEQIEKLSLMTAEATLNYIDWQSFRREAAKEILCAIVQHDGFNYHDPDQFTADAIAAAIGMTDVLIQKLREEQK